MQVQERVHVGGASVKAGDVTLAARRFGFPRRPVKPVLLSDSTKMLLALSRSGKHMYEGTVPGSVKASRRAKNRASRRARRVHRKRSA